ncbi:MAG: alcohol dehydrogenase catalytic domain-containing protein [Bryobacteraceae bacterium]
MHSVHLENGRISIRETAIPERPPGFALIRMRMAGICNTDLELQRGYYGFSGTPGHEFVGEVFEADLPLLIGRRVVGEINLACGDCDFCSIGLDRHCPNRTVLGIVNHPGAFAGYLVLPERNLHVLPDEIPDEDAVFTEPLAAACEILDQVTVAGWSRVAVLGDGKLGLLIAQVLHVHGAQVTLFGRHAEKLSIAAAAGIDVDDSAKRPRAAFPFVVDATGSAAGLKEAVSMTRPRGILVLKSTVHGDVPIDTAPIIVNEITMVGSRCGRFEPALALLCNRQVNVAALVSAEFPLDKALEAFAEAARPGVLKVLLRAN